MPARRTIGKKLRFEVFKRDGFKCQYCGASAPDVILEVDHINPVSKGGENDLLNLITSCRGCNAGKSDVLLSDDAAIQKQRAMLEELSMRREQLEMMLAWRDGLKKIDDEVVETAAVAWEAQTRGWSLNDSGRRGLKTILRTVPLPQVLDAIEIAAEKYLKADDKGNCTAESVELAWAKVGPIAKTLLLPDYERRLLYIRGICRNRFSYCNDHRCIELLKEAYHAGVDIDTLTSIAKDERNWTGWQSAMLDAIEGAL